MQAYAWMERIEPAPLPRELVRENLDSVQFNLPALYTECIASGTIFRTAVGQGLFLHGKNNEKLSANNEWWFAKE